MSTTFFVKALLETTWTPRGWREAPETIFRADDVKEAIVELQAEFAGSLASITALGAALVAAVSDAVIVDGVVSPSSMDTINGAMTALTDGIAELTENLPPEDVEAFLTPWANFVRRLPHSSKERRDIGSGLPFT